MSKAIVATLLLVMSLVLAGCALSYHEDLVSGLQDMGPNPYITEPELQDLEGRIRERHCDVCLFYRYHLSGSRSS